MTDGYDYFLAASVEQHYQREEEREFAYVAAIERYFTREYEEDESLTEAFEQLRAVIGDNLDTSDARGFEEDENVSDTEQEYRTFAEQCRVMGDGFVPAYHNYLEARLMEAETQLERQTNRALKWRRQAAYYRLRESRCMGEANYTSVERVDELEAQADTAQAAVDALLKRCAMVERQRDHLTAALRKIIEEGPSRKWAREHSMWTSFDHDIEAWYVEVAADALARLKGENKQVRDSRDDSEG